MSYPPLDDDETEDHQIELHWPFQLANDGAGTLQTHTLSEPRPKAGADQVPSFLAHTKRIATVREGMSSTQEHA